MAETFDAYHKWLGIPPHERPTNHYRLLAIDLFESDPDVIAFAADQRMAHVRTFQSGPRAALSQQILNEIAAARVCLLNPEKKAEYDQQLQMHLVTGQAPTAGTSPEPAGSAAVGLDLGLSQPVLDASAARRRTRRPRPVWQVLVGLAVGAVVCGVVLALALRGGGRGIRELAQGNPSEPPPAETTSNPARPEAIDAPQTPQLPHGPQPPDASPAPQTPKVPARTETPPDAGTQPPGDQPETKPPEQPPAPQEPPAANPTAPQPQPVPDAETLAAAEAGLSATIANASPTRMVATVLAGNCQPAECFYLLSRARKAAAEAGDATVALQAEEELLRRFSVDGLQTKADTLVALAASPAAAQAAEKIAGSSLALVDEAAAAGNPKMATMLAVLALKAARDADDRALIDQVTLKIIQLRDSSATPGPSTPAPNP